MDYFSSNREWRKFRYKKWGIPDETLDELFKIENYDEIEDKIYELPYLDQYFKDIIDFRRNKSNFDVKNKLGLFFDNLPVGVFVTTAEGFYIYFNKTFLHMINRSNDEILGSNVRTDAKNYNILMGDIVLKEKRTVTMFQDIYNEYTREVYRQFITQTPIFDKDGNIIYIVATLEKVSALNERLTEAQNSRLSKLLYNSYSEILSQGIVAESPQMQEILRTLNRISRVDSAVLVTGESGTGKEVIVKELHRCSDRSEKPLVDINCAALPEALLESELFGYEKGAFTGADSKGKKGLIEQANGGILFLDEINSMPLSIQSKFLRVLETKTVRRIGGRDNIPVDFRIVSATNADLEKLCEEGKFRNDLLYRLNVIPIDIPPLRERKEDIPALVELFANQLSTKYGKNITFSADILDQLIAYEWPGNIRELKNVIERAIVTCDEDTLVITSLSDDFIKSKVVNYGEKRIKLAPSIVDDMAKNLNLVDVHSEDFSLNEYLDNCEKKVLEQALSENKSSYEIAKILKISQSQVIRKKQKYGL